MDKFREEAEQDGVTLSEAQETLIAGAETGHSSQQSKVRVATDLYVINRTRNMVNELRDAQTALKESNVQLSKANEAHARSLKNATWWLAGATVVLAVMTGLLVYYTSTSGRP
jgi:CHASE3 domain sensor protein